MQAAKRSRTGEKGGRRLGRRDFLVGTAALAAGAGLAGCSEKVNRPPADGAPRDGGGEAAGSCNSEPSPLTPPAGEARVVDVSDPNAVTADATLDEARVQAMLLAGLCELAGQTDIKQAWKTLLPDFASSMRIGLKVNCLSTYLQSSPALVKALIQTLVADLGADAQKIFVWDRRGDELANAKLTEAALGVKVSGSQASTKDSNGPGYESAAECARDRPVHLSRILTEQTDITINLALLKKHDVSGITGALKNVYGCIAEPGTLHDQFSLYSPALYRLDRLRQRMRLHITEGLLAVIKGDTDSPPDAKPGRLLLAADPLALDVRALDVINQLRGALPPIAVTKLGWIDESDRLHLGSKTPAVKSVTQS